MELIRLENICKTYYLGEVEVPVLRGISLSIHRGEMVALMGASGSGKTTLMNILGCLDHPTSGKYWLDGQEMSRLTPNERALVRTEKLGFVFQSFNLLARTSALQNVVMPLDYSPRRQSAREARRLAQTLLDRVGLADRAHHEPSQMSGGQQQRVAIGRALVNRPALVLADEPTGNLDSHTSVEILRMFQQLNAEGITVVLVTHDPQVAAYAHRTIRIVDGMIEGDETNPSNRRESRAVGPHAGLAVGSSCRHPDERQRRWSRRRHGNGGGNSSLRQPWPLRQKLAPVSAATSRVLRHRTHCPSSMTMHRRSRRRIASGAAAGHVAHRAWRAAAQQDAAGLSALGVIIAVAAVIAMTEIGQGSKATLQKSIASMGANTLMIFAGSTTTGGVNLGHRQRRDAHAPGRRARSPASAPPSAPSLPLVRARSQIVYGNRNWVPEQHQRHHALATWRCAIGRTWRQARCSPTATSATATRCA